MAYRVSQAHLDQIRDSKIVENHLLKIAKAGADGYRRRVHRLTGELANSIEAKSEPGRAEFGSYGVAHAIPEEFGNRFRPGHPALRPAMDDAAEAAKSD